ncbi:MAG: hypothetical protein ABF646_07385, partial [Acetobacter papayae]
VAIHISFSENSMVTEAAETMKYLPHKAWSPQCVTAIFSYRFGGSRTISPNDSFEGLNVRSCRSGQL